MDVRRLANRITIILGLVLCAVILFRSFTQPISQDSDRSVEAADESAPGQRHGSAHSDNNLTTLFRLPENEDAEANEPSENWISKKYNLELKGTVSEDIAVILDHETNKELLVHPNEDIGSCRVEAIRRNELVLDGEKGREKLNLPAKSLPEKPSTKSVANVRIIERETLNRMLGKVDRLAEEISLQPVRSAQGELAGFRITSLKPRGVLAGMGLRKHDILKSINGLQIQTPEDAYRVLGSAQHENSLTLIVRRSKSDLQFHYQIK